MLSLVVWINKYGGDFMPDYSTIYILYSCNEWKEYNSMRFIAASTGIEDIYMICLLTVLSLCEDNIAFHKKRKG